MNQIKTKATILRRKGRSYGDINKLTGIPKSTLSSWFSGYSWSKNIRNKLVVENNIVASKKIKKINKTRSIHYDNLYHRAEQEARNDYANLKNDRLFLSGLNVYWGEGDKSSNNCQVRVSNIDPRLLKIFHDFLLKICHVPYDRIGAEMLIYPDLDADKCLRFWSRHVNIPTRKFSKTITIQGRHRTRRVSNYGVCIIRTSNKYLKKKIIKWIDLLSQDL